MNVRPESVGLSSERLARIRPAVEQSIGPTKIAGAVTLVARHGKVAHYQAVGLMDRNRQAEMRLDALFCIYSMTKPNRGPGQGDPGQAANQIRLGVSLLF